MTLNKLYEFIKPPPRTQTNIVIFFLTKFFSDEILVKNYCFGYIFHGILIFWSQLQPPKGGGLEPGAAWTRLRSYGEVVIAGTLSSILEFDILGNYFIGNISWGSNKISACPQMTTVVSSFLCEIVLCQFFEERQILTNFSYRVWPPVQLHLQTQCH